MKKKWWLVLGALVVCSLATIRYTYAYLNDSKTSSVNLRMDKGSIELYSTISDSKWTYLGNATAFDLSTVKAIPDKLFDPTQNNQVNQFNQPNRDIGLKNGDTLGDLIGVETTSPLVIKDNYTGFYNVKPGDIFMRKIELKYAGDNTADFTIELGSGLNNFVTLKEHFDILCAIGFTDINGNEKDKVWFDSSTSEITPFNDTLSKNSNQLTLRIVYRCKDSTTTFDGNEATFKFKVENHLKVGGGSKS